MAITVRSSNGVIEDLQSTNAANHTINISDAAIGDLRVICLVGAPSGTTPAAGTFSVDIPSGWTEIGSGLNTGAASDQYMRMVYRVVQSGDTLTSATLNVTFTGGSICLVSVSVTYEGVDTTTPIDVTVPTFGKANGTPTNPDITTITDGAMVCMCMCIDANPGVTDSTIPSNSTVRGTQAVPTATISNGVDMGFVDILLSTAGALSSSSNRTWGALSEEYVTPTFALRPVSSVTEQEGFRFREDNGSETGADWKELQDVDATVAKEENIRLRMLTDTDGDPATRQITFQYKRDDEAASEWRDV